MTKTAKRILIAAMSVLFVFAVAVFASACEFLTDPAYTVTVDYDETKGTVTLSPAKDDYILGDQVTVTVEANEGFFVQSFEVNGLAAELTGGRYSFRVEGDTAIAVEFADAVPAEYVGVWHTQEGDPFGEHTISIESDFTVTVDGAPAELRFTVVETPDQTGGESTFDTVAKLTWDGEDYTIAVDESYGFNVLTMDHDGNKYFVKEGAVSDVTFDLYLGTWTGGGYTVVITEDGITINDAPAFVYGKSGPYYRFLYAGARFNLSQDYFSDNLVLQDAGYHEIKLAPEGAEELQIPDTWNGTWTGEGARYELKIDNTSNFPITIVVVESGMEMSGLNISLEEQYGTLHAIFDAYVGEEGEDVLFDLGYFDWDDHMLLSWQGGDATLYREGGDEPPADTNGIDPSLYGTWEGTSAIFNVEFKLEISATLIRLTIDGGDPMVGEVTGFYGNDPTDFYVIFDGEEYEAYLSGSKITLDNNETGQKAADLTRTGDFGGGEQPPVAEVNIPSKFHGTFHGTDLFSDDEYTVVITEHGVSVGKNSEDPTAATVNEYNADYEEILLVWNGEEYSIGDSSYTDPVSTILFQTDDGFMRAQCSRVSGGDEPVEPTVTIPGAFHGEWHGENEGTTYDVVVTEHTITVSIDGEAPLTAKNLNLSDESDAGVSDVYFSLDDGNYFGWTLSVNSQSKVTLSKNGPGGFEVELTKDGGDEPPTPGDVAIEESYWGTEWDNHSDDSNFTLAVSDDGTTVTINGGQFTVTEVVEWFGVTMYTVSNGATEYTLEFYVIYAYVEDTVNDIYLNLIPADAQEVAVDAALDGTWTGTSYGATISLTIADGHISYRIEEGGESMDFPSFVFYGYSEGGDSLYFIYLVGNVFEVNVSNGEMTLIDSDGNEVTLTNDSGSGPVTPPTPPTSSVTIGEELLGNWYVALVGGNDVPASRFDITVTEHSITVVVDLKADAPIVAQNLRQDSNTDIYFTLEGFEGEWNYYLTVLDFNQGSYPTLRNETYSIRAKCTANGGQVEPEFEGVPESVQGNYNVVDGGNVLGTLEIGNDFVDLKLTDGESGKVTLTAKDVVAYDYDGVRYLSSIEFAIGEAKFKIAPDPYAQTTLYLSKEGTVSGYTGYLIVGELVDPEAEGPGGGDDTPSDPVPSDFYGTFVGTGDDTYTVTISEDGITVQVGSGNAQAATNVSYNASWDQITFNVGSVECTLYPLDDDNYTVLYFLYGNDAARLTVQESGSQGGDTSVTLADTFNGVWTAFGDGAAIATLTVEGGKLSIGGTAVTLAEKDASHFTFSHNGVDYTVSMDYLVPVLVLESAETTVYYYIAGNVPTTVNSGYEGTWKSVEGSSLQITITIDTAAGTVTINGETVEIIAGADGVFGPIYAFVYNGELYKLNMFFDTVQLNQDIDLEKA